MPEDDLEAHLLPRMDQSSSPDQVALEEQIELQQLTVGVPCGLAEDYPRPADRVFDYVAFAGHGRPPSFGLLTMLRV